YLLAVICYVRAHAHIDISGAGGDSRAGVADGLAWRPRRSAGPRADRLSREPTGWAREPAGRTPRDGRMDPRADWLDPLVACARTHHVTVTSYVRAHAHIGDPGTGGDSRAGVAATWPVASGPGRRPGDRRATAAA